MSTQQTEIRLSDVFSDGLDTVKHLLLDGKLRAEQVGLPPSPWTDHAAPRLRRFLDVLLQGVDGDRSRALALRAVHWLAENNTPFVGHPQYVLATGRGSPSRAALGAADGSLMVEIGRTAAWKAERAADTGTSLLLVPHGFEAPVGLLLTNPDTTKQPPALPAREARDDGPYTGQVLALAQRLLELDAPYLADLWQDPAARHRVASALVTEAGLAYLAETVGV